MSEIRFTVLLDVQFLPIVDVRQFSDVSTSTFPTEILPHFCLHAEAQATTAVEDGIHVFLAYHL